MQAFALAERLSLPVMVCMDGFVLTHAMEEIDVPDQDAVDAFLPPFAPRQWLDPDDPVTIGAMVGPEAVHRGQVPDGPPSARAPSTTSRGRRRASAEAFGRDSGGLLRPYRTEDAEVVAGRDGIGARHRCGRRGRAARRGDRGRASWASPATDPGPSTSSATRCAASHA